MFDPSPLGGVAVGQKIEPIAGRTSAFISGVEKFKVELDQPWDLHVIRNMQSMIRNCLEYCVYLHDLQGT